MIFGGIKDNAYFLDMFLPVCSVHMNARSLLLSMFNGSIDNAMKVVYACG